MTKFSCQLFPVVFVLFFNRICILVFALQESLGGMTRTQFRGIIDRLTAFTSQNLKKLVAHMNLDSFFANVDKVVVRHNNFRLLC